MNLRRRQLFVEAPRVRMIDGRYTQTIYASQQAIDTNVKVQDVHLCNYVSKKALLALFEKGCKKLTASPWVLKRIAASKYWAKMSDLMKECLLPAEARRLVREFWDEDKKSVVKTMISLGNTMSEVAAYIFRSWDHKIKTSTLVRKAVFLGWTPRSRRRSTGPPMKFYW